MKATTRLKFTVERSDDGWDALGRRVETNVGHAAQKWATNVKKHAKMRVPVRTGALRDSIATKRVGTRHWKVSVGKEYGVYVEYGTRYMHAQPYFRPAIRFANAEFRKDIAKAFKNAK